MSSKSFITLLKAALTQFFQHYYCSAALTFWGRVAGRWSGSRLLLVASALPNILSNDTEKSVFISFVYYNHTTQSFTLLISPFGIYEGPHFFLVSNSFLCTVYQNWSMTYLTTAVLHLICHIMVKNTTKPIHSSTMTTPPLSSIFLLPAYF